MQTNLNVHLGPATTVHAPEWADAYLDIAEGGHELGLFLGSDDADRLVNVENLIDALQQIRIRLIERMVRAQVAAEGEQ